MKFDVSKVQQQAFLALVASGAALMATSAALAQSAPAIDAPVAVAQAAAPALPKTAARMKPVRRTEKPVDLGTPVTTGSVAKTAASAAAPAAGGKPSGRCTRLAFEVNDYGKDGPTKDAQSLLDKHIAGWAAGRGIKTYKVGKKVVNCRLFLDFGFFDEHTCRAEAPVCW
jgi:hypothetical protein